MNSTEDNNTFEALFKSILDRITNESNEKSTNLFDIDSGHDFLFEETLASVTTRCYDNIPSGCSGEDRFVWSGMQNKLFDNVKFFGVYDKKNEKGERLFRQFFWKNNDGNLQMSTASNYNFSRETGRFLYQDMFEIGDIIDGTNYSFLFQTVHDAGKMLINTHLSTVSNQIDSAGTPKNDKRNKKWKNDLPPSNYNTEKEGVVYTPPQDPELLNQIYVNGTVFSDNGSLEDGNWASSDDEIPLLFRPWFDTKYSLLIFKYIVSPFMVTSNPGELARIQNSGIKKNFEINIAVINFIWQVTLYFCLKSFVTPDNNIKMAIAYLRTVIFVDFKNKRDSYYQLRADNPYIATTNSLFGVTFPSLNLVTTAKQKWVVTQALCAQIILNTNPQGQFTTFSVSQRNADGEQKVDTNTQYLFSIIQQIGNPIIILRAMQLLKFSGDTSHTVQTLLQYMSLSKLNNEYPDKGLPKRISILTTLERILSVRMLKFIANTNITTEIAEAEILESYGLPLSTTPEISVMFNTGTYLQDKHSRNKELINQIKAEIDPQIEQNIKYYGVYVMQNPEKQLADKKKSIDTLRATISASIPNLYPGAKNALKSLYDIWEQLKDSENITEINEYYTQLSKLFDIAKSIPVDGVQQNIVELFSNLSKLLNESLNLVLYGFMRKNIAGTKNVPNLDAFYSKGKIGELSNLTLNMDHGDPYRDFLSNYKLEDLLKINIESLKNIINSIFEFIDLQKKITTEVEQTPETLLYQLLFTAKFKGFNGINIEDLWCQSFDGDFIYEENTWRVLERLDDTSGYIEPLFPLFNLPKGKRNVKVKSFSELLSGGRTVNKLRNLLITSDKFSQIPDDNMPIVAYSNSENSSSIAQLVKHLNLQETEIEGWAFLKTTLKNIRNLAAVPDTYNVTYDFLGIIHLIIFFVNSGKYTKRPFTKNKLKIYNEFKEQSEQLILLLEQLNTIAPKTCPTPTPIMHYTPPSGGSPQKKTKQNRIEEVKNKGKTPEEQRRKRGNERVRLRKKKRASATSNERHSNNNNQFDKDWEDEMQNTDISSTLIEITKNIYSNSNDSIDYIKYQLIQLIPYALTVRYVDNDIINKEIYFLLFSIYNIVKGEDDEKNETKKKYISRENKDLLISYLNSLKAQGGINIEMSQQIQTDPNSFISLNIFDTTNGFISLETQPVDKKDYPNVTPQLTEDIMVSTTIDKGPTSVYLKIGEGWKEKRSSTRQNHDASNYTNNTFIVQPSYYWFAYKNIKETYIENLTDPKDYQDKEDITPYYEEKFEQIKSIFDILMRGHDILDVEPHRHITPKKLIIRFILNNLNFIFKTHLFNCIERFLKQTPLAPEPTVSVNLGFDLDYYNLIIDLLYVLYKSNNYIENEMPLEILIPETIDIYSRYADTINLQQFVSIITQFDNPTNILHALHDEILKVYPLIFTPMIAGRRIEGTKKSSKKKGNQKSSKKKGNQKSSKKKGNQTKKRKKNVINKKKK